MCVYIYHVTCVQNGQFEIQNADQMQHIVFPFLKQQEYCCQRELQAPENDLECAIYARCILINF